jgi:hypothetical protein
VAQLIIQPSGGPAALAHYADSIGSPVDLQAHADLLSGHLGVLRRLYPSGRAPMWGVTPGMRGTNVTKYNRSEPGDVVLFTGSRRAFAAAVMTYKLHSPELARRIWGEDENGQTWENIYFLDDVWQVDIPYELINRPAGYRPEYNHLGFNVLGEEASTRVFEALGPGELPLLAGLSFGTRALGRRAEPDDSIGADYEPVDETRASAPRDPFSVDPNEVDRGLRGHARTQNALAAYVTSLGHEPLRPRPGDPDFDLAWEADGQVWVAEVKSMTAANTTRQLRLAVGQVLDYADRIASTGRDARPVIAVELEPERRWIELCLRHGIVLVWPERFEALE